MKAWIGKTLIGIGILHSIGGFTWFHPILSTLFNSGLLNTISINEYPEREAAFWFFFAGFALMLIGSLVNRLEHLNENIPVLVGWGFVVLTALGIIIMPISGFWLLIIPTVGMIRRRRNKDSQSDRASLT